MQLVRVVLSRGWSGVGVKLTTHLYPLLRLCTGDAAFTSASHFCRQCVDGKDFTFVSCSRYVRSSDAVAGVEMWKVLGRNANKFKVDKETPGCILTEGLSITFRRRNLDSQLKCKPEGERDQCYWLGSVWASRYTVHCTLYTQQWYMSYRFVDRQLSSSSRMELQFHPDSAWKLFYKPVWHVPSLSVQWITPDNRQRKCPKHIAFHSKINLRN
jgi:hypothetical protein